MRFVWRITMAKDTHSEYVILIAFPRQKWLRERASILRYTYIAALVLQKHSLTPNVTAAFSHAALSIKGRFWCRFTGHYRYIFKTRSCRQWQFRFTDLLIGYQKIWNASPHRKGHSWFRNSTFAIWPKRQLFYQVHTLPSLNPRLSHRQCIQ